MLVVVLSNLDDVTVEIEVKVGIDEETMVDGVVLVVAAVKVVLAVVVVVIGGGTFVKAVGLPGLKI